MANQLAPVGQRQQFLQQLVQQRQPTGPLDQVFGSVEVSFLFVRPTDGQSFECFGQPVDWSYWYSLAFSDSALPVTPGGQVNHESNARYVERSSNGNVSFVPGYGPDVPGIANHFSDGALEIVQVPFSIEELQESGPYLQTLDTIRTHFGAEQDAYHVNVIVWMVELYDVYPPNLLWSAACVGCGWMQVNSHMNGDVAPYNLVAHEFWHASDGQLDTYWPLNDGFTGVWDCQAWGVWNNGGRWIPAPLSPASWHWWSGVTVESWDSLGTVTLGHRQYVRIRNPLSGMNRPEWIYLMGERAAEDGLPTLQGTRLLVIGVNRYADPQQWPPTTREVYPADGEFNIWPTDPYPAMGNTSVALGRWEQSDAQPGRPIGLCARNITTVGDDSVRFEIYYGSSSPYLGDTRILNEGCLVPGGTVSIAIDAVNYGNETAGGVATVTSEVPSFPTFQLQVPAGVQPLDTAHLTVIGTPQIPYDLSLVGALVPIAVQFDSNTWMDTLQVYLPPASGQEPPLCTGPTVGNSYRNLAVFASDGSTVTLWRDGQPAWSRGVGGSVIGVAIDTSASYVGVATDSGRVYQIRAANGSIHRQWSFPGQRLAHPGVAFAHGLITFFVGDRLHRYSLESGDPYPPNDVIRETVGLPVPAYAVACGADSTYCVVAYDSASNTSAAAVIGFSGRRIFPPADQLVPVSEGRMYEPSGGDLNNADDLRTEYVVPTDSGHVLISYSLNWDSVGVGEYYYSDQDSNVSRHPVLGAFGWTRPDIENPLAGAAMLFGVAGTDASRSIQAVSYDGQPTFNIFAAGEDEWNVASVDIAGSGVALLRTCLSSGRIAATWQNGASLPVLGSPWVTPSGTQHFGPPLVVEAANGSFELWVPRHEQGGWRYARYRIGGGADWYGANGDGQNTRCHSFRGRLADPSVFLTIGYHSPDSLLLYWTMRHPADPIEGYEVYQKLEMGDPWTLERSIPVVGAPEYWAFVPVDAAKKFYTVYARIPGPNPNAPDGSTYWGQHEQ